MIEYRKVDGSIVYTWFAIISITGPVFGAIGGGNMTAKLGGYTSEKAINMCIILAVFCMISAVPIPFVESYVLVFGLMWFLFFFGAATMPCATGIMLNTVP